MSDLDDLVSLFEQYRAFYKLTPRPDATRTFLRERLARTDSVIFVAVDDATGKAAGFVQLYPTFSSLRMARALILNDLFVDAPYRRQGVARQLMNAARAFAQVSGAAALQLETAKDNRDARRLYESLGYRADEDFMTYTLEVGTP